MTMTELNKRFQVNFKSKIYFIEPSMRFNHFLLNKKKKILYLTWD